MSFPEVRPLEPPSVWAPTITHCDCEPCQRCHNKPSEPVERENDHGSWTCYHGEDDRLCECSHCDGCAKPMDKTEWNANDGLCADCRQTCIAFGFSGVCGAPAHNIDAIRGGPVCDRHLLRKAQ